MKAGLLLDPTMAGGPDECPRFTPERIPARYGLKSFHSANCEKKIEMFAADFLNSFIDDLNPHLKRTPGMREALVKYL
jgi:hypothetical protein